MSSQQTWTPGANGDNGTQIKAVIDDNFTILFSKIAGYVSEQSGTDSEKLTAALAAYNRIIIDSALDIGSDNLTFGAAKIIEFTDLGQITTTGTITFTSGVKIINSSNNQIFDVTTFAGSLNQSITPEWFGAAGDGLTDDGAAFKQAFALSQSIVLLPYHDYYIDFDEILDVSGLLDGNNSTMICGNSYTTTKAFLRVAGSISGTATTIAASISRNDDSVVVASASGFAVGDVINLHSVDLFRNSASIATGTGNGMVEKGELKRIKSISGTTIVFDCPIFDDYDTTITLTKLNANESIIRDLTIQKEVTIGTNVGIQVIYGDSCKIQDVKTDGFYQNISIASSFNTIVNAHQLGVDYVSLATSGASTHTFISGLCEFDDSEIESSGGYGNLGVVWDLNYTDLTIYKSQNVGEVIDSHQSTGSVHFNNVVIHGGNSAFSMGAKYVYINNVKVIGGNRAINTRDDRAENIGTGDVVYTTPIEEFIVDGLIVDGGTNAIAISNNINTVKLSNIVANSLTNSCVVVLSESRDIGSFMLNNVITNAPVFAGAMNTKIAVFTDIIMNTNSLTYDFSIFRFLDNTTIKYLKIDNFNLYNNNQPLKDFFDSQFTATDIEKIDIYNSTIDATMSVLDTDSHLFQFAQVLTNVPDLAMSNIQLYDDDQFNYFLYKAGDDVTGFNLRKYNVQMTRTSANEYNNFSSLNIIEY